MPYLQQRGPLAAILGAFFLVFLPLALLLVTPNFVAALPYLYVAYAVGLGTSHFFITLAVYLQAQNRAHFAATLRNRLIYFAAPIVILGLFALSAASDFRVQHAALAAYLFSALRFFDFFHVGRQSTGVLQLLKRGAAPALPGWLPRAENAFFVGMALLQWETFLLGGRFDAERLAAQLPAWALGGLACAILMSHLRLGFRPFAADAAPGADTTRADASPPSPEQARAPLGHRPRQAWLPPLYFALQAISAAAAVFETRLYIVALAMHYVEYHVIMHPRCFESAFDPASRLDRAFAFVRARPGLFYGVLAAIVLAFELRSYAPAGLSPSTRMAVHAFDGIFFVHYFLEAFLWKLSDPFYRRTLAPLYLDARPPRPRLSLRALVRRMAWFAVPFAPVALLMLATGSVGPAAHAFERLAIAPLDAENHLRWGVELAGRSELVKSRRHLGVAVREHAQDPRAKTALEWVERRLSAQASGAR